jgi:hypothetical protein
MHSRSGSAASSLEASGAEITGLPAIVISARMRPSPGVVISSARQDMGTWPKTSGAPRTRLRQRPNTKPSANSGDGSVARGHAIGLANIDPPGRSRLPVSTFSTSIAQEARVPNSWLHVPIRPYTAARGAEASSRARRRMRSAGTAQAPATASGVKSRHRRSTSATPLVSSARRPRSTRSSAKSTWQTASSSAASVPGRIGTHSSARSAVPVRRGSITTTLPPRARIASKRPGTSAAARRLPWDACGFAPRTRRWSVRSRSGVGILHMLPYSRAATTFLGHWSTVPAE